MKEDLCDICPLLFCDPHNPLCRQTPEAKVALVLELKRRDRIAATRFPIASVAAEGNAERWRRYRETFNFVPDKSLAVKYDKRRKPDSPRRQWERRYRKERRQELKRAV